MIKIELPESLYKELSNYWIERGFYNAIIGELSIDTFINPDTHYSPEHDKPIEYLVRIQPNADKIPDKMDQLICMYTIFNGIVMALTHSKKYNVLKQLIERAAMQSVKLSSDQKPH